MSILKPRTHTDDTPCLGCQDSDRRKAMAAIVDGAVLLLLIACVVLLSIAY